MKQIALVALLVLGVAGAAAAAPWNFGHSTLVGNSVPAPVLDASQPPVAIVPPIRRAIYHDAVEPSETEPIKKPPRSVDVQEDANPSVIDKLKAFDRKKNAWFKRTFLGR
ncbi:hypothetical protein Mal15_00290 [Stieleria maiorica]|uniref:Uncharacterized protein n=1 Tax=Stieleria maiorica TaxID=2795974 RepID=A0A5B9M5U6_9BACT|nr:hypothetical protein [Stieleria maiorica]QEF96003.1 hypothetical protein Mal15_00290 [Stieleria maiorica]